MRHLAAILVLITVLAVGGAGYGAEQKLPVIKGKKVLAMVNDEPITLEEFRQELATLNKAKSEKEKAVPENEAELLKRLVDSRLMVQEGRRIGLDDLPEVKKLVDVFSRVTLREMLVERQLKNVKASQEGIERLYKEFVKEWKINSVLIEKEEDAKKAEEELKAGKPFDELARKLIEEGKAKGGGGDELSQEKGPEPPDFRGPGEDGGGFDQPPYFFQERICNFKS